LSRAAVLRTVMGDLQEPNPQALPSLTRVLASCSEADEVREEGFPHSGEAVPQLLSEGSLIKVFEREIQESQQVFLASAFCSGGVFNLLHKPLERLKERKGRVYLLTSFMGHHNNPRVLMRLQQSLPAGEVRIYDPEGTLSGGSFIPPDFHIKAYLFEKSTGRTHAGRDDEECRVELLLQFGGIISLCGKFGFRCGKKAVSGVLGGAEFSPHRSVHCSLSAGMESCSYPHGAGPVCS